MSIRNFVHRDGKEKYFTHVVDLFISVYIEQYDCCIVTESLMQTELKWTHWPQWMSLHVFHCASALFFIVPFLYCVNFKCSVCCGMRWWPLCWWPRITVVIYVVDITVLLALSVFQLIVNEILPESSQSVPIFGQSIYIKITTKFTVTTATAPVAAAADNSNNNNNNNNSLSLCFSSPNSSWRGGSAEWVRRW